MVPFLAFFRPTDRQFDFYPVSWPRQTSWCFMNEFATYSWLLFASTLVTLTLSISAARQSRNPVAYWFSWLMLAVSFYSFGYGMELASATLIFVKSWLRVQYLGIAFIPALIMATALSYRQHRHPPLIVLVVLLGISALTLALHFSNDRHQLFYAHMAIARHLDMTITQLGFGPWYYVHVVYLNLALLLSSLIFFRSWHTAPDYYRRQASVILMGSLTPWLSYLIYLSGAAPMGIDLSPFGFVITGPLYAYGLFRYSFVDLTPIARGQVFDDISDVVLVLDMEHRLVDFNRVARQLFPELSTQSYGYSLDHLSLDLNPLTGALSSQQAHTLGLNGRYFDIQRHDLLGNKKRCVGYALILRDVTDRQQLLNQLQYQADYDGLTHVYNRRMILEQLKHAMQHSSSTLSVAMFDIDHFKRLNDNQGHLAGDQLLCDLCACIRSQLGSQDHFGRYGGDEFLLVFSHRPLDVAHQLMKQVHHEVNQTLGIGLSVGMANFQRGEPLQGLIHRADSALYQAKRAGRNQIALADLQQVPYHTLSQCTHADV